MRLNMRQCTRLQATVACWLLWLLFNGPLLALGSHDCEQGCVVECRPVCGEDGRSYMSSCLAECSGGVQVAHRGYCRGEKLRCERDTARKASASDAQETLQLVSQTTMQRYSDEGYTYVGRVPLSRFKHRKLPAAAAAAAAAAVRAVRAVKSKVADSVALQVSKEADSVTTKLGDAVAKSVTAVVGDGLTALTPATVNIRRATKKGDVYVKTYAYKPLASSNTPPFNPAVKKESQEAKKSPQPSPKAQPPAPRPSPKPSPRPPTQPAAVRAPQPPLGATPKPSPKPLPKPSPKASPRPPARQEASPVGPRTPQRSPPTSGVPKPSTSSKPSSSPAKATAPQKQQSPPPKAPVAAAKGMPAPPAAKAATAFKAPAGSPKPAPKPTPGALPKPPLKQQPPAPAVRSSSGRRRLSSAAAANAAAGNAAAWDAAAAADAESSASSSPSSSRNPTHRMLSIIGADERKVCPIQSYPYSTIGRIMAQASDGEFLCTGGLIGRDRVLTAAHCVWDDREGNGTFLQDLAFAPSAFRRGEAQTTPVGTVSWDHVTIFELYADDPNGDGLPFDIAVIGLDKSIGDKVGWLGVTSACASLSTPLSLTLAGYPGDSPANGTGFPGGCLADSCPVTYSCRAAMNDHECDSYVGQSGAPMFDPSHYVRMVHTLGILPSYTTTNQGVTLTKFIVDAISQW